MASFIPYYRKKQQQRHEREGELLALLQKGAPEEVLLRAAEELRQAEIRAAKERIAKLQPCEKSARDLHRLESEVKDWEDTPSSAVLERYRERAAHLHAAVAIPRAPRRGHW